MQNKTIKFEGFEELEQQLKELSEGYRTDLVARNTLVKAVKQALVPAYSRAYSLAHLGPPNEANIHMKETLRIDGRIPTEKDKLSEYVTETDVAIAIVSVKKSAVSLANEFGTSKRGSKPFLRPALATNAIQVIDILKDELTELCE